ncbi:MAG: hypothetical protein WKF36_06560 [Candidatus Nitrosocosmicus sp.]
MMLSEIKLMITMLRLPSFLVISCFALILIYYDPHDYASHAQWILQPPPPPGPSKPVCCDVATHSNDTKPPQISIVTEKLYEGNNVIKLKIIDESPLIIRGISYTGVNKSVITYLAKKHNSEYTALLKVSPPYTKVTITAIDVNGNHAKLAKNIKVEKGLFGPFISSITNSSFWRGLFFGD